MKIANKVTIYNSDIFANDAHGKCRFDYEKEWIWEIHEDEYADEGWQSIDDIPDQVVYDRLEWSGQDDFDDFKAEMSKFLNEEGNYWLATGYCGCWDGHHEGGCYIRDFDDFSRLWDIRSQYEVEVYDEGGHLYVEVRHHDGTNCYEIVGVTERGQEFMDSWWRTRREEHQAIMSCNFYHYLPHFAKKVYGTSEFKYAPDKKKASPMPVLTTTFEGGAGEVSVAQKQEQNA